MTSDVACSPSLNIERGLATITLRASGTRAQKLMPTLLRLATVE